MDDLVIHERPAVDNPSMVLGFTGWMDGVVATPRFRAPLEKELAAR